MNTLRLMWQLALRNLWAHWIKSLVVGGILFFGTFLFVLGSSLLDSIEVSMQRSITASLSGHLQLYDADARDKLALFGDGTMSAADIGEIDDFAPVEQAVMTTENVAAVVPMGQAAATVFGGNEIDDTLGDLREAVKAGDAAKVAVLRDRVKVVASTLLADSEKREALTSDRAQLAEDRATLDRVLSPDFWASFEQDPLPMLDFMDSRLAPLATDGRLLYFRILGTDLDQFTRSFDRFEIVQGENVPPGKRGLLLNEQVYQTWVKNKVARDLDAIREAVVEDGKKIAEDQALRDKVARNARQYQRILFQMNPADADRVEGRLREMMPQVQGGMPELLQAFLAVDDENLEARHRFFYEEIAPTIRLYEVNIGDEIPLRAFTKAGYLKSVNVRVYGTFQFKGLEDSNLAGGMNLTDMLSFREMYGKMSEDQRKELASITESVGVKDVSREDAEAALFGGGGSVETTVADAPAGFDEFADAALLGREARSALALGADVTPDEIRNGLALNAAVLLKDPSKLAETQARLAEKLGPMGVKVVDWREASGIVGQFILVMQMVLYLSIGIMLLVALVIINNAMVMATLERTPEIGTMRAIGAQKNFVMWMFVVETLVLGLLAGALGAGVAGGLVAWLHQVGIPAPADVMVVLFAGRSLYPTMGLDNVLIGMALILGVSLVATLYPARLAAAVPPVVALQGKE